MTTTMQIIMMFIVAANFIYIFWKFSKGMIANATLDLAVFIFIALIFSLTGGSLNVGMGAGLLVSIYLHINPPNFKKAVPKPQTMVAWLDSKLS